MKQSKSTVLLSELAEHKPKNQRVRQSFENAHAVSHLSHFTQVLSDRNRVGEHIEECLKASSKCWSVTGSQNHHNLFLQTGTGNDQ